MLLLAGSAAAANFGFQLKWSKFTPDGPLKPPRAFLSVPSAVVTTEYVAPTAPLYCALCFRVWPLCQLNVMLQKSL